MAKFEKTRSMKFAGNLLTITEQISRNKTEVSGYRLTCVPSSFGIAIRFDKTEGGTDDEGDGYCVHIDGLRATCECKGFLRWDKACRHITAVYKLMEVGKLPE